MRKLKILILCLFFSGSIFAQISYTLQILDTKSKPLTNVEVTVVNQETGTILKSKTDNSGKVHFDFTEPGNYSFSYLEVKNFNTYEVKEGLRGSASKTVTYDPKNYFAESSNFDRSGVIFKTLYPLSLKGQSNVAKVIILVKSKDENIVPNLDFEIVDIQDKCKFVGRTDSNGLSSFYLPVKRNYEIDIAGIEAARKINIPDYPGFEITQTVYYERTLITETSSGDTIRQTNIANKNGTTSHLFYKIKLIDFLGNPLANEVVYAKDLNSKLVYETFTDVAGDASFMLLKGTKYVISLKYEQGVHLVDALSSSGFASASSQRRYRGSAEIERMLAERGANNEGFVVDHESTPVFPAQTPSNYLTPTDKGFDLDFGDSGETGTPTIAENKVFVTKGFYSPDFYCLQALTGKYLWGIELGESGLSPVVYHDGVLLINTYSCTLYAIEASTGNMLWSKWLAGTIFSTPSADSSNVYVVYDNGGSNPKDENINHVLTCFDLRTGKLNWIKWVDDEVIACPVVEGNEVHVASQSGKYYVFNKTNGDLINFSESIHAVSSPTLTKDNIFITAKINGSEKLLVLDRKTFFVSKTYSPEFNSIYSKELDCYGQMNYNGAHPIVYKNEVILLLDSVSLVAFDANSEKMLWKKNIKTHSNQIPIVAGDRIIVGTLNGDINSYDVHTGEVVVLHQNGGEIDSQPVSDKTYIYFSTSNGVVKAIKVLKLPDLYQWNKDSQHNLYWK